MEEVVKVEMPKEFAEMTEEEVYDFLIQQDKALRKTAAQLCLRGKLPEYAKERVEKGIALKEGMVEYEGIYVKQIVLYHIPKQFTSIIDKYAKSKKGYKAS